MGPEKSWKVLKFEFGFFRTWKSWNWSAVLKKSWIWIVCSWPSQ